MPISMEDAILHVLERKMKLNPGNYLIEFNTGGRVCISLLLCHSPINWLQILKLRILAVNKLKKKDRYMLKYLKNCTLSLNFLIKV